MTLLPAILKDDALIAEMDALLSDSEYLHAWWLGQSGFLPQWNGRRVLIDPYLSDSLSKKYAATDKPHTRMSELVVDPALLKNISVVTSSHNHTDHLDAATLAPVLENNPGIIFIIPEANRDFVSERVARARDFPTGLNDGMWLNIDGIKFYGIPAMHNQVERDENGNCKYMGYVIEWGNCKIYHSGDTLWFEGMVDLLKPFEIDLAILPVNGNDPARRVAGNLDCREAAELGKAIGAKVVIPCHYNLFTFNTADVKDFITAASELDQPFAILEHGQKFSYPVSG